MFFGKIIWAVNAMEDLDHHGQALSLLGAFSRATQCTIEPVYVLSPPYFSEPFRNLAEENLNKIVKASRIPTMLPGKIIENSSGSVRQEVEFLIDYAKRADTEAILVATHARTGLARLTLGSFAETLALHSPIPMLSVNPSSLVREKISKILFPTDFRRHYRESFEKAVALAKVLDSSITAFYKEPPVPLHAVAADYNAWTGKENQARLEKAEEWRSWAATFHVPMEIVLDNQPGRIATAVEQFAARNNFDLIAMPSESTEFSAVMMGSHVRQVLRESECPVWVIRLSDRK